eukprot:Hpha_TRINITY_DN16566_c0_g1::TRINITY_DN16566_c0_g1_i1::g.134508::m.134508/K00477/PHYH; phytanoyl-CoA hydroxylase
MAQPQLSQTRITAEQWAAFQEQGFVRLGKVLTEDGLRALQGRMDDIMLRRGACSGLDFDRMMMQLDSPNGRYEDIGAQTFGHKGPTLKYRKIQNLDLDPLMLRFIRMPVFEDACRRAYGNSAVSTFRTMFMNKPAVSPGAETGGTPLGWHQDRWVHLDRDPKLTVWTALDRATTETGCVEVIRGSHKLGVVNPNHPSSFLTPEQAREHCPPAKVEALELEAGEVVLLHNWTIHRSGVNRSRTAARRALSINYMDADTRVVRSNDSSLRVGSGTGIAAGSDVFPLVFPAKPAL